VISEPGSPTQHLRSPQTQQPCQHGIHFPNLSLGSSRFRVRVFGSGRYTHQRHRDCATSGYLETTAEQCALNVAGTVVSSSLAQHRSPAPAGEMLAFNGCFQYPGTNGVAFGKVELSTFVGRKASALICTTSVLERRRTRCSVVLIG
jgi:hypothetical protein